MQDLKNKVVLVSGAGGGIGAALAQEAGLRGARVVVTDVRGEAAEAVCEELRGAGSSAIGLMLDVTSADSWLAAVDEAERALGPIDLLCSNAGVGPVMKPILELPVDYLRWVLEVNLFGAVNGVKSIVPRMVARGEGHVLVTASVAGFASGPLLSGYNASKHALIAVCESLRAELSATGVGLSVVCPAAVETSLRTSTLEVMPQTMARALVTPSENTEAAISDLAASAGGVMSAREVAQRALDGVQAGQFYIFTHRDSRAMALARDEEVRAAFERS